MGIWHVTVMTTVVSTKVSLAAWQLFSAVISTAAWPIEPATGRLKPFLVAGVLPKHGAVQTPAHIAAGTGRVSGGVVTGVTVTTAPASTLTTGHGVTQVTAIATAGIHRASTRAATALLTFHGVLAVFKKSA